eukprot:UN11598
MSISVITDRRSLLQEYAKAQLQSNFELYLPKYFMSMRVENVTFGKLSSTRVPDLTLARCELAK